MSPTRWLVVRGNTRSPISVDQIKQWCGNPDVKITVKPTSISTNRSTSRPTKHPTGLKDQNTLVDVTASSRTAP